MNAKESSFSEFVFAYTRAQALADGVQVEVSSVAAEAGIHYPVFLTRAVSQSILLTGQRWAGAGLMADRQVFRLAICRWIVVATANDVSQLPPEMLRKGRFDELFAVDLPVETEREAIWKIVVERRKRKALDYDVQQLARISEGLTGAEIEAVFDEAMFSAFERSKEPTDLDVAAALNGFVPLSKLMAEQIAALRQWSVGRARPSTSTPNAEERKLRKLGV